MTIDYTKVVALADSAWGHRNWRDHVRLDFQPHPEVTPLGGHSLRRYSYDPPAFTVIEFNGITEKQRKLGYAASLAEYAWTLTHPVDADTREQVDEWIAGFLSENGSRAE